MITSHRRSELLVSAAVLVIAVLEVIGNPNLAPKAPAAALEGVMALVLVWRRTVPFAVTVTVAVLTTAEAVVGVPLQEPLVPLVSAVIAVYSLGVHRPARTAAAGIAVMVSAIAIQTAVQHKGIGNLLFGLLFAVGTWVVARVVRARTHENAVLHARTQRLAEDNEVRAQQAAQAERARIARELHDVISHSVSVMVVQAGAAEQVVHGDPDRAGEAMRTVQQSGRQALSEMAHLLGMLREGGEEIGLSPQPGIAQLPDLLAQATVGGLAVELHVAGVERPVPLGVQLSMYRIIQEALTNVRKHAGAARATVALRYLPCAVEVEIADDGAPVGADPQLGRGGGHGLIGMRERVAVYGGTLQAGPESGRGYVIRAQLPIEGAP